MAHSLKDIEIWCQTVVDSQSHVSADPDCLPIPWRDYQIPQKLCFGEFILMRLDRSHRTDIPGFLLDDGIVKPLPPVTAALLRLKKGLEAAGHVVVEFCMYVVRTRVYKMVALLRSLATILCFWILLGFLYINQPPRGD